MCAWDFYDVTVNELNEAMSNDDSMSVTNSAAVEMTTGPAIKSRLHRQCTVMSGK